MLLEKATQITNCLVLDDNTLKQVMEIMENEFRNGLKDEESATIKMLITYVRSLPNNKEKGRYLALDLGGTNFRVILIDLDAKDAKMDGETFKIPEQMMTSEGEILFDFIADCIIKFTTARNLTSVRIALGFTFSFPCTQIGLSQAKLNLWTKGFSCPNVVGKDVVKLLKRALKKKAHVSNAFVDIVALINDTTGTLMSCAHTNPECNIGLIVGTGTNACYVEKLQNIDKWPSNYTEPQQVVINCEWGAFGDNGVIDFIRTEWDRQIDEESINKGRQKFEKMVSGMYLGEIVRRVLLTLIQQKVLFNGKIPKKLSQKNGFPTKNVSKIDLDHDKQDFYNTRKLLEKEITKTFTETDLQIIQMANSRAAKRAAHLVAAGCAQLIVHMDRKQGENNTIAYDGSVIRFHPYFLHWLKEKIKQLLGSKKKFDLMLSEDGSGRGAAIVAAVQYREKRPKIIKKDGKVYEIGTYIH